MSSDDSVPAAGTGESAGGGAESAGGGAESAESAGELAAWLERLDAVEAGFVVAAARKRSNDLTAADPSTGEQWEEGQVWGHLSEFVPYWIAEARLVVAESGDEPAPFGRVKSDAGRLAAIAERRHEPVDDLATVVLTDIGILRSFLIELGDSRETWARAGRHSTLGVMDLHLIFEEFLVGHLEQHLRQLEDLAA
jgi:hypothetical protein